MAGHVLELRGCTPEPLGNYLKGLGVFRLIAEQADPQARAWWKDGSLRILQSKWHALESASPETQLADWLVTQCQFTPLIAPWQTGTGYLPLGKRSAGGAALTDLLRSDVPGTQDFRAVFRDFASGFPVKLGDDRSQWLKEIEQAGADWSKSYLHRSLRNRVHSASGLRWLDVIGMSLSRGDDSKPPWWFPLLANGGGESSGQYVVNHQQRLNSALLGPEKAKSRLQLLSGLIGDNHVGTLEGGSMGAMYYPSLMEAPNVGQNFVSNPKVRVNPWDFILLLEGTLAWSMAATRRQGAALEQGSFPFYCKSSFGGSTTIGPKEVEGSEQSISTGEIWCPIWNRPSTFVEVQRVFGEGRLQIGHKTCSRSLDFALAMKGFGLDRGIEAFHRYSLMKRSGSGRQTTLLAVPSGSFIPERSAGLSLLTELRGFSESIAKYMTASGQQPRRFTWARIEFERAWFDATTSLVSRDQDALAGPLSELLAAAGILMRELGLNRSNPGIVKVKQGQKTFEKQISPVGQLSGRWTEMIGRSDDSSGFRIARAIGGLVAWGELSGGQRRPAVESARANLLPVSNQGDSWAWDATSHSAVWSRGAPLASNFVAMLRRRLIDAKRGVGEGLPLWSFHRARFEDILALWQGEADEQRIADMVYAFSLVNAGRFRETDLKKFQQDETTPDLQTGAIWFGTDDRAHVRWNPIQWRGRTISETELRAAFELPRVYHLLKLCFVGGRLPRRPVSGVTAERSGSEPYPPDCLDVLTLIEAGRISEAALVAGRRLRAKGYPPVLREPDLRALEMDPIECRRLAGLLLVPIDQPGILAALAIKPENI